MPTTQTPTIELQTQLWKARAQAKQKWLEWALAEPAKSPKEAARRLTWIKQALDTVKRGRAEITHQAALMDAYAEHLTALEMTLMSAAEEKNAVKTAAGRPESKS